MTPCGLPENKLLDKSMADVSTPSNSECIVDNMLNTKSNYQVSCKAITSYILHRS